MLTATQYTANEHHLNLGIVANQTLTAIEVKASRSAVSNKALRIGRLRALVSLAKPQRSERPDLDAMFGEIEVRGSSINMINSAQDLEDDECSDSSDLNRNVDDSRFDDVEAILERVNTDLRRLISAA